MSRLNTSETAILSRLFRQDRPTFSSEVARDILAFDFDPADKDRMRQLSAKAREGMLSPAEQFAMNNYQRIGHLLSILQSKARLSLKKSGAAPTGRRASFVHGSSGRPRIEPMATPIDKARDVPMSVRAQRVLNAVRRMSFAEHLQLLVKAGLMTAAEAQEAASRTRPVEKPRPKPRTPRPAPAKKPAKVRKA